MTDKLLNLHVRLTAEESDLLDRARGSQSQSTFIGLLIRQAAGGDGGGVAGRDEALTLLSEAARAGRFRP